MTTAARSPLPPRPDVVLRLAFAGTRTLPEDPVIKGRLEAALEEVFSWIVERVTELAHDSDSANNDASPKVIRFYSTRKRAGTTPNPPCVRLISGLAEGADDLAIRTLHAAAERHPGVRFETAGVLAFSRDEYRASRVVSFRDRFDELYRACAYVVELDGIHDRETDARRQRAYRAQTTVLLRQADLFIALTDASGAGKPGGTQEAVRAALAFGLPVVLIDTTSGTTMIIEAHEDAGDVLTEGRPAPSPAALRVQLRESVSTVLAGPDMPTNSQSREDHGARREYAEQLLDEFFHQATMPPVRQTVRQRLWRRFETRYAARHAPAARLLHQQYQMRQPSSPAPAEDAAHRVRQEAPYRPFRTRASNLTRHYAGLYRGAFLLNFGLAAVAVGLAAVSLVLLAGGLALVVNPLASSLSTDGTRFDDAVQTATMWLLFGLGVLKLGVVGAILLNTRAANDQRWNERAVDYRYLAERLRAMFYLPGAGSFQLAPASAGYSARVVRQSAADWLFDAIVRHVSPQAFGHENPLPDAPALVTPDPAAALRHVRDRWLFEQAEYHQNNADKMHAMFRAMEHWGRGLNIVVVVAVCVDLLIALAGAFHVGPHALHALTPWLLFLAALLPVTVAAVNGIRFQSECQQLADRSRAMVEIIAGRWKQTDELHTRVMLAQADAAANPGAWTPAVLRRAESIAVDMMNEAADWSVLYSKEIVET